MGGESRAKADMLLKERRATAIAVQAKLQNKSGGEAMEREEL